MENNVTGNCSLYLQKRSEENAGIFKFFIELIIIARSNEILD
jgi:hypothetical protein